MSRKRRFSKVSLIAALLSATPGTKAAEHPVYPSMPYQANQNFYNVPTQPMQNRNFYPNAQQQFPVQNPAFPTQPNMNPGYPYQTQIVNPSIPIQTYPNVQSQYPPYNTPYVVPPQQQTYPVVNPQMSMPVTNSKPVTTMPVQQIHQPDPNLKTGSSNIPIQQNASQSTKPSNINKNNTLKMKNNSSVLNKIVSSSKNVPLKTVAGLFLGAILGGFSDKTFSCKSAVIGAIAGTAAGALCDHFTGDLSKSIKAIKEIWKGSNTATDNKTKHPALTPKIPLQAPVNQNTPILPASTPISPPSSVQPKTFVMDDELRTKVTELSNLQNKYIRLMYAIKYVDASASNKKALFSKLAKIEEANLLTGPAIKFMSECSFCLCDIRNSQFKSNTEANFKEQRKIINDYLSRIPTLYTREDLVDLIPRVKKCLSKLIEFRDNQMKSTKPQNNVNENSKTSNTEKTNNNEKKVDKKASSDKVNNSKVTSDKSVKAKKSIV